MKRRVNWWTNASVARASVGGTTNLGDTWSSVPALSTQTLAHDQDLSSGTSVAPDDVVGTTGHHFGVESKGCAGLDT